MTTHLIQRLFFLSTLLLVGCGTTTESTTSSKAGAAQQAVNQAVQTPFNDLNLVRAEIPPVLHAAMQQPYATPTDKSCNALISAVEALDLVLGADLDMPPSVANSGLVERGQTAVGDAAAGALRRTAEGVIPFRGWVRKLSGAERYSREVSAAIAAGTIRRAYLKGLGEAAMCAPPASPKSSPK